MSLYDTLAKPCQGILHNAGLGSDVVSPICLTLAQLSAWKQTAQSLHPRNIQEPLEFHDVELPFPSIWPEGLDSGWVPEFFHVS